MVSFARDASFHLWNANGVGTGFYARGHDANRAHDLYSVVAAAAVPAVSADVCRCRRRAPERVAEKFIRQGKAWLGSSRTRGRRVSERTHDDRDDPVWICSYTYDFTNEIVARAFFDSSHGDCANFLDCTEQVVSGSALLKRCSGRDSSGNSMAHALLDYRGNIWLLPGALHSAGEINESR